MSLSAEDRLEIIEIAARACYATDHFEAEAWADLFTDDGIVKVGDDLILEGHAALIEYMRRKNADHIRKRHLASNGVVEGDGDTARMRAHVTFL